MIGYNPSHLNTNETLLEAFHRVEAYLKANPQYQVYQSSAQYLDGKQEYALNTIIVPEGSKVSAGDVVLFSNAYYAVIISVSETTFSVATATNFRGMQGPQGPKGDSGIGDAQLSNTPGTSDTNGYTQKAVNGLIQNPNLLINPNFAINQRGRASYTGSTSNVYCVDRWYLLGDSTFDTASKKVSLLKQYSLFWQDIENYNDLKGKTVTFSISVSNVSGDALYMKVSGGQDIHITTDGIYTVTTTLSTSITKFGCGLSRSRNDTGEASCVVNWAKLEIGSVATEFSPPSIAEELEKCQRYYIDIGRNDATSYLIGSGVFFNATLAYVVIPIPTTLRKTPTVILGDLSRLTLLGDGISYIPTEITWLGTNNNNVTLRYTITGATAGTGCAARLMTSANKNTGILAFDAEI